MLLEPKISQIIEQNDSITALVRYYLLDPTGGGTVTNPDGTVAQIPIRSLVGERTISITSDATGRVDIPGSPKREALTDAINATLGNVAIGTPTSGQVLAQ